MRIAIVIFSLTLRLISQAQEQSVVAIQMPDGTFNRFKVWETPIMEKTLANHFPDIKTYTGKGIDDPYASVKIEYSNLKGMTAMILSINGNVLVEGDVSYYSKDINRAIAPFTCKTYGELQGLYKLTNEQTSGCSGSQLFTLRLAVAVTGEYSTAVAAPSSPSVSASMAAIVTTINRVNAIYERDLALRFILVANNNSLVYLNPSTDPYTNGNATLMMNENQSNTDNVIGFSNYDLGMVFGTGDVSSSFIFSVCNSLNKAKTIAGLPNPTGDLFDVGRVAHNLAHKFGVVDTHNSNDPSCNGGGAAAGFEPGSGTTVTSVAGSCGNDNLQPAPDPFFHGAVINTISAYLDGPNVACKTITNTTNRSPRILNMFRNGSYIPIQTPFTLDAFAVDDDNDPISYSWEEYDNGPAGQWNTGATTNNRPIFKSRVPKATGQRTFPDISVILAGYPTNPPPVQGGLKGEVLPAVTRTLRFGLTVRDGFGGVVNDAQNCSGVLFPYDVYVVGTAGPFIVTIPNGGEIWTSGSAQVIMWDAAGTTSSPINASTVTIRMSTDGGFTYPYFLAQNVPNDGYETVILPNISTNTARIKVEAATNIFFDISNNDFSLSPVPVGFELSTPSAQTLPCPSPTSINYSLNVISNGGYNTPVNLTVSGLPTGVSASFNTNPVTPGSLTTLTLNNLNTLQQGSYFITVNATSGNQSRSRILMFTVQPGVSPIITSQPISQTDCEGATITFNVAATGAQSYQWQLSTNFGSAFNNITGATSSSYSFPLTGSVSTSYRWRVIVIGQCNNVVSNVVSVTGLGQVIIVTHPQSATICEGRNTTFTASIGAGFNPVYQWQVNTGSGFSNIPGANSFSYVIAGATNAMNGNQYRLLVRNPACSTPAISNPALLTVNQNPVVSLIVSGSNSLLPGMTAALNATISIGPGAAPFNRIWYYGSSIIGGANGDTYVVSANKLGDYRLEVADAKGCRGISNTVNIKDSVSQKLFILPNPNDGNFNISYHQPPGVISQKRILICNSLGQKVKDQLVNVSVPYQLIPINISAKGKSIYIIQLIGSTGQLEAREKILIQ